MVDKLSLLIELFGEEIPARMQLKAVADLKGLLEKRFQELNLRYVSLEAYVTPRRLCFAVESLDLLQPDISEGRKGPKVDAPNQAIQGFLKSTGLTLKDCEKRELDKGVFYFARIEKKGKPTKELIPILIQNIMEEMTWPKSMRWQDSDKTWVRPLHSGICILGEEVLPFEISFGGGCKVSFSNVTQGHRFMAPQALTIKNFKDYKNKLRQTFVLLDHQERKQYILEKASELARSKGLMVVQDERLLDEVTGLVEWPVLLMGPIEERFMKLPPEVLITVMKTHQKYFALQDASGKLAPYFLMTTNLEALDKGKAIITGNSRVLKARFSDAEFFYELDQKKSLEKHAEKLDHLIFHADLGTMAEKTNRLVQLSTYLADQMHVPKEKTQRAALLAKADLVTEMVAEFPELQGIMGRYYAATEGQEIAQAIEDHYGPKGIEDKVPVSLISKVIALADKIDTLVGFFGIDIKPTGSKDPYALRRTAIGILRLVEDTLTCKLADLFTASLKIYETRLRVSEKTLLEELNAFMMDRLKVYWKDQGIRYDTINAVLPKASDDSIATLKKRALALEQFIQKPDGEDLLAAYKRASNIVRIEEEKDKRAYANLVNPSLLHHSQEKALIQALEKSAHLIQQSMQDQNFEKAMQELSQLKPYVDAFFDQVTVNDNNAEVRENRLNLLSQIRATLEKVADFSKIERG